MNSTHYIAFVPLPDFSHLGLAAAIEPLFIGNWLLQREQFRWKTVSVNGNPVRASNGMVIPVEGNLTAASGCRTIFVLASFEPFQSARNARLLAWLRRQAAAGAQIGGIENGSLALAHAGLLERHTTAVHWDNLAGFKELFPRLNVRDQLYSIAGNFMTCAGASAVLDLMLAWIQRDVGERLAQEIRKHLLLGGIRSPSARNHEFPSDQRADPMVLKARELIRERLEDPMSLPALAKELRISHRQLQRRFIRQLGHSIHRELDLLRMERAHQYLQQTTMSVAEVAFACGFNSPAYFARIYRRVFGRPPRGDRQQSTTAPVFTRVRA